MKLVKLTLLSATVLAGTASMAQAQVILPASTLHGVGATSIENILVQEMNCEGGIQNPLGTNAPATITEGVPSYAGSPSHACSATGTAAIQPNLQGFYTGTGSGGGRNAWETLTLGSAITSSTNPFPSNGNHFQFAFSDGPLGQGDITAYNGLQTAQAALATPNVIGNPIQIPMYVLPVALAYPAAYGYNGTTPLLFNVKVPVKVGTTVVGGLRLTQANYCGIFNGTITNWNDAALKTSNGNQSLMDLTDPRGAAGWASEGAPIRLVGRSESSGTTTIFTRHLAAVCGTDVDTAGGTNKFNQSGNGLPFYVASIDPTTKLASPIDLKSADSATIFTGSKGLPSSTNANYGNTIDTAKHNAISGAYYNKTTSTIVGTEASGLFMVAEGSDGVAQAISDTASNKVSGLNSAVTLNGKFGYVSADFIAPVTGQTLYAAALSQVGKTTVFLMPTGKNAAASLTELPPQTTATNGAYNTADTRQVTNPTTHAVENLDRANPLHWTAVLYKDGPLTGLAQPTAGYAITGTTQLITYTCFANDADRLAVANLIGLLTGKAAKQNVAINAGVFSSTSATAPGLTTLLGAAPMPAAWNAAIAATFLTNTAGGLGTVSVAFDSSRGSYYSTASTTGHGLMISSAIPTSATTLAKDVRNADCTAGQGA